MPSRLPSSKLIWPLAVVLLSLVFSYFIFKGYFFHPNGHMFAFGGDALVIYYDMIFNICHDHGTMLTGMAYPYGEYVFLTDAQGAFTTVLQWVNRHLFNVCDCIPGIVHGLNIYLLPVSCLFVFYILRYFNVRNIHSVVFAVLITFLSPQMIRFGGHFGLAYPFVIPMAILWMLRKHRHSYLEKRDALFVATMMFFTFNNPYVGFSATGFLICAGLIYAILTVKNQKFLKNALITGGIGLFIVLLPFMNFMLFDPVSDRIKTQWGFFYYHASFKGLFIPPDSLLYKLLHSFKIPIGESQVESWINLGIVGGTLLLFIIIISIFRLRSKHKTGKVELFSTENKIMLASATLMFIYAVNYDLYGFAKNWMENHLGPLLMFKASGRLAWSFYFAITITGVVLLDGYLKKLKSPGLSYVILFLLAIIWVFDIQSYIGSRFKNSFHPNFFNASSKQEMLNILNENKINIADYQAMVVLPKLVSWSDNFLSDLNWSAQFYSMRISAATGLPLVSAMLSRISNGQAAESIQMLAHPMIERELINKFPNQKDLLLLVGVEHPPLTIGEQYLIDISTPLYSSNNFSLYRLSLKSFQPNKYIDEARAFYVQKTALQHDIIHMSFTEESSSPGFYSEGAKLIPNGKTTILDQQLPILTDTQYVFTAWSKIEHDKPGLGEWEIIVTDTLDQIIFNKIIEARKSNDIQDMWIRSEAIFPAPGGSKLKVIVHCTKDLYVDDILIYPIHSKVIIDLPENDTFLFNGYKVKKE